MEDKLRASEHSERIPEIYIFDYSAEKHIKYGSNPPLGGRTGAEGGCKRLAERSEGSDACILLRRGWGRGGGVRVCGMLHSEALQHSADSHDLPDSKVITIVPPKGAKGASYASEGKEKAALADTALPSPAYRQEGAHVAAENTAITIVPPKGAKGTSASERG